jgi:hypothetical protein
MSEPMQFSWFVKTIAYATVTACALAAQAEDKGKPPAEEKPKPKFTIGKETTYITEPLRPDGYPDYVEALNQRMSEGVTPENNAAVLLLKAFGPNEIPERHRAKFFKKLGIQPLPEQGNYFVTREEMVKRWRSTHQAATDETLDQQFTLAAERPWTAKDYPMVAEWLRVNDKPLRSVTEASDRPRQFFPIVLGDDVPLIAFPLACDTQIQQAVAGLAARAMFSAGIGKTSEAWRDLLACHRLARLNSFGAMAVDAIVSYGVDAVATNADVALFHSAKLSRNELLKFQRDLKELRPFPNIDRTFEFGERFIFLDAAQRFIGIGFKGAGVLNDSDVAKIAEAIGQSAVDWDVVMRMGNAWIDRLVKVSRLEDHVERLKGLEAYGDEIGTLAANASRTTGAIWDLFSKKSASAVISSRVGAMLVKLLLRALPAVQISHDRTELMGMMDQTACALAIYRSDRGRYPDKLSELVPKYLDKIPGDTFSREESIPIHYRRDGGAYLLWSVGNNGIDDNGRTYEDLDGDDWVLRPVPVKRGDKK